VTFAAMTSLSAVENSFGAFFGPLQASFHAGPGATSIAYSITAFLDVSFGLVAGPLSDRYGARRVLLLASGLVLLGLGLTARVGNLEQMYVTYGIGLGTGIACAYFPLVGQVASRFRERRGLALGTVLSGVGVGTMVGPAVGALLIDRVGWRTTYDLFAIACSVVLILCAVCATQRTAAAAPVFRAALNAFKQPRFAVFFLAAVLLSFPLWFGLAYLVPYSESRGLARSAAIGLVVALGLGSLIGRAAMGALADGWGASRLFQLCAMLLVVSLVDWLAFKSPYLLAAGSFVFGLGYGGWVTLLPKMLADTYGPTTMASNLGLIYGGLGLGALIVAPAVGAVADLTGGYFVAIVGLLLLGTAGVATLRIFISSVSPHVSSTLARKQIDQRNEV